jgi:hypothetical protein
MSDSHAPRGEPNRMFRHVKTTELEYSYTFQILEIHERFKVDIKEQEANEL